MSRLFERMDRGEVAYGAYIKGGPHLVMSLANAGFDFVRPDMMFSSIDWKEMDHIIRTAQASGITSWVRVPSNPWSGGTSNMQVTVDAARAFSLGADAVQVSVASAEQVRGLIEVGKDWHRSAAGKYPTTQEEHAAHSEHVKNQALVVPSVESLSAIDEIDEIVSAEGLRCIFIACTDLSAELGHPFDYEHPDVWKVFDEIVTKAAARGLIVIANTGYPYNDPESLLQRTRNLKEHGAQVIMLQGAEFLLETYTRALLIGLDR